MIANIPQRYTLPAVSTAPPPPAPTAPATPPGAPATAPTPAEVLKPTPYQKIKNSAVGRFVRDNKILAGTAAVGASIAIEGASAQYPAFSTFSQYGIVPAVGAGAAVLGAAAIHDALVNDLGKHNMRAAGKMTAGAVGVLGGVQTIGQAYDIRVLDRVLANVLGHIFNNGEAILGASAIGGGIATGRFALDRFTRAATSDDHRSANLLLGLTASGASASGVLGGLELIGRQYHLAGLDHAFTRTVELLARTGVGSTAGGAYLVAGSGVLAQEAVQNLRKGGNDFVTVAEGMGATVTGLGGLELLGHGLGIKALAGLLTYNLDMVGAAGVTSTGAALTRYAVSDCKTNGLSVKNSIAGAAGATMVVGGVASAAVSLDFGASSAIFRAAECTAGVGCSAVTAALALTAYKDFRKGDVVNGTACAAATTVSSAFSLGLIGEGLGVPGVTHVAEQIREHTVEPFFEHVVDPAGTFLFDNPIVGGAIIAVGVGAAYAWYRHKHPNRLL